MIERSGSNLLSAVAPFCLRRKEPQEMGRKGSSKKKASTGEVRGTKQRIEQTKILAT